jgi:hypothetical protein
MHHTVFKGGKQGTMWGASNERPVLRLNSQKPFGLDWPNGFFIDIELMNEANEPLDVYVAITYEYILKSQFEAARYRPAYLRWVSKIHSKFIRLLASNSLKERCRLSQGEGGYLFFQFSNLDFANLWRTSLHYR